MRAVAPAGSPVRPRTTASIAWHTSPNWDIPIRPAIAGVLGPLGDAEVVVVYRVQGGPSTRPGEHRRRRWRGPRTPSSYSRWPGWRRGAADNRAGHEHPSVQVAEDPRSCGHGPARPRWPGHRRRRRRERVRPGEPGAPRARWPPRTELAATSTGRRPGTSRGRSHQARCRRGYVHHRHGEQCAVAGGEVAGGAHRLLAAVAQERMASSWRARRCHAVSPCRSAISAARSKCGRAPTSPCARVRRAQAPPAPRTAPRAGRLARPPRARRARAGRFVEPHLVQRHGGGDGIQPRPRGVAAPSPRSSRSAAAGDAGGGAAASAPRCRRRWRRPPAPGRLRRRARRPPRRPRSGRRGPGRPAGPCAGPRPAGEAGRGRARAPRRACRRRRAPAPAPRRLADATALRRGEPAGVPRRALGGGQSAAASARRALSTSRSAACAGAPPLPPAPRPARRWCPGGRAAPVRPRATPVGPGAVAPAGAGRPARPRG